MIIACSVLPGSTGPLPAHQAQGSWAADAGAVGQAASQERQGMSRYL